MPDGDVFPESSGDDQLWKHNLEVQVIGEVPNVFPELSGDDLLCNTQLEKFKLFAKCQVSSQSCQVMTSFGNTT